MIINNVFLSKIKRVNRLRAILMQDDPPASTRQILEEAERVLLKDVEALA